VLQEEAYMCPVAIVQNVDQHQYAHPSVQFSK
jgi:hypothetical protein